MDFSTPPQPCCHSRIMVLEQTYLAIYLLWKTAAIFGLQLLLADLRIRV